MGLYLQVEMRLRQMLAQECSVCKQIIDERSQMEGEMLIGKRLLRGWDACPCCLQQVEEHGQTIDYKRRFVRWCIRHGIKPT